MPSRQQEVLFRQGRSWRQPRRALPAALPSPARRWHRLARRVRRALRSLRRRRLRRCRSSLARKGGWCGREIGDAVIHYREGSAGERVSGAFSASFRPRPTPPFGSRLRGLGSAGGRLPRRPVPRSERPRSSDHIRNGRQRPSERDLDGCHSRIATRISGAAARTAVRVGVARGERNRLPPRRVRPLRGRHRRSRPVAPRQRAATLRRNDRRGARSDGGVVRSVPHRPGRPRAVQANAFVGAAGWRRGGVGGAVRTPARCAGRRVAHAPPVRSEQGEADSVPPSRGAVLYGRAVAARSSLAFTCS